MHETVSSFLRTVGLSMGASSQANGNTALAEVLDGPDKSFSSEPMALEGAEANGAKDGPDDYYEEHVARIRAEGEAADAARRLAVAQEQIAEYAAQRETEAADLVAQASSIVACLQGNVDGRVQAQEDAGPSDGSEVGVANLLTALFSRLQESAEEARAFAAQQRADAERSKRTFSQVNLHSADASDVDMGDAKRFREFSAEEDEEGTSQEEKSEESPSIAMPQRTVLLRNTFRERARYIPLRLSSEERRLLALLEAALSVSQYTDKVDIMTWKSKVQRIHLQIKEICQILCGLVVAENYKRGQALIVDRTFKDNAAFFQDCFEVGRRHKIMNPDKMRAEYGKLVYMLMDSVEPAVADLMEFSCVRPLQTVYTLLEEAGGLALLDDPLVERATAEIIAGERPRLDIQRDIKMKEKAREQLAKKYRSSSLSEENILCCLYSISDNNSFLTFNRDPIDRMLWYLRSYFQPDRVEPGYSLGIHGGMEGARLTHNHERQYHYVLQSLTLWREISHEMFRLWMLAESDLLRESNTYRLTNTGQGLNRVQQAPSVGKAMHGILGRCQQQIGDSWVGSSVIHLGDHNVPNALMFIDKYTQVPRILNPVVLVLDALPKLCKDDKLHNYVISVFGSVEACRKAILLDFFRHAFDGGGADNFFDAGSCIDGRLTSAWNWGSKIEKKSYYHVFKLAGFTGFDGDFK
eukprot:jgi/Botrbrau1/14134/Bobra.182_3s0075.1